MSRKGCCHESQVPKRQIAKKFPSEDDAEVRPQNASCSKEPSSSTSNLTQFLNHTTPRVQLQYLPKTCLWDNSIKRWRPSDNDTTPFFTLGDLWDSFDEWSAYGASVPLVLHGNEAVVQYYVPYLSGIQLYTRSGFRTCLNLRKRGEESDDGSDYLSSEASSDNESDEGPTSRFWKTCHQNGGFCSGRKSSNLKDYEATLTSVREFSSDEEDNWGQNEDGHLFVDFFEDSAPYSRVPLSDKITELSRKIPDIRTMRSFELLPASWLSIAWYPIYRIPTGPTLKDLATSFLTFHSLSTPLQGVPCGNGSLARLDLVENSVQLEKTTGSSKLVLKSFGLASYKLRGAFWTAAGSSEKMLASKLESNAEMWLKGLHVRHPDYEFFASRSPNRRP